MPRERWLESLVLGASVDGVVLAVAIGEDIGNTRTAVEIADN